MFLKESIVMNNNVKESAVRTIIYTSHIVIELEWSSISLAVLRIISSKSMLQSPLTMRNTTRFTPPIKLNRISIAKTLYLAYNWSFHRPFVEPVCRVGFVSICRCDRLHWALPPSRSHPEIKRSYPKASRGAARSGFQCKEVGALQLHSL